MGFESIKINHMPDQIGVWFEYTGFRLKDHYDIETKTGKVYTKCYPNGYSFYAMDDSGFAVDDEDVAKIRLTPDSDLEEGFDMTGEDRYNRNMRMFAGEYAIANPTGKPYPTLEEINAKNP